MLKDECSMTKSKLEAHKKSPGKIVNIVFKKRASRNPKNDKMKYVSSISQVFMGKTYRSLPKINEKIKIKNEYSTMILNYCDKKKHLSFYKGSNINVSSILLDGNRTACTNTHISLNNNFNLQKNFSWNNINEKNNEKIKTKREEINSNINPLIDVSKLNYEENIISLRNKFSIKFNKEFDLLSKFIQKIDNLKFETMKKEIISQLHDNLLSCAKNLSGIFLAHDIENLKINSSNLTSILTNLLNIFSYTNKINQFLINQAKNLIAELNKEKQNKIDIKKVSESLEIKYLKNKIKNKNDTVRTLRKEQIKINNDNLINMYKLRDEKRDLLRLLLLNKNYYEKFHDLQKEIKEKNQLISQKNFDYKMLLKKNVFDKVELEELNNELQKVNKSLEQENKILKDKLVNLESEKFVFDSKMKKNSDVIYQLQENLAMKNEELIKCEYDFNELKNQNEILSFNYLALKSKINYFNEDENNVNK